MALPSSILAVLLLSLSSFTSAEKDNADECDCFRTNGSSSGFFLNHQFHDYRNVAGASSPPALTLNATNATNAVATSKFFTQNAWKDEWAVQNWNNSDSLANPDTTASILMVNTANNVYIGIFPNSPPPPPQSCPTILTAPEKSTDSSPDYTSYLTLRTSRHETFQSVAEIDSQEQDFQYLSARFLARVTGSPGACAGLFTYLGGAKPADVQEADIEILTRDPRNRVQYTNQPSTSAAGDDVPQATVNGTQARDWTVWNTYRVDWMPKMTTWYVNGESVAEIAFQTPKDPAALIVNMWSDGGVWTGNMTQFDEAFLQIQWIEVAYNTSGPYGGSGGARDKREAGGGDGVLEKRKGKKEACHAVCGVDDMVNVTGTPTLLFNSTGAAAAGWRREGVKWTWVPVVLAGTVAFGFM